VREDLARRDALLDEPPSYPDDAAVRGQSVIETMLPRGTITREMAAAADKFREAFRISHMDLCAPPICPGILAIHFSGRRSAT
jgi:hypothetical protein